MLLALDKSRRVDYSKRQKHAATLTYAIPSVVFHINFEQVGNLKNGPKPRPGQGNSSFACKIFIIVQNTALLSGRAFLFI